MARLTSSEGPDKDNKDRSRLLESARLDPALPTLIFLGIDDRPSANASSTPATVDPRSPKGVPYFAWNAGPEWELEGGEWGDARASGSAMSPWEAGVFAESRALVDWNVRNKVGGVSVSKIVRLKRQHCPACGSFTYSLWAGWKRACVTGIHPIEGKEPCFSLKGLHNFAYPRTDPVSFYFSLSTTHSVGHHYGNLEYRRRRDPSRSAEVLAER